MYKLDEESRQLIIALKTICAEKGIKPHKLAQKAGISTSTMSYLMNGKTNPEYSGRFWTAIPVTQYRKSGFADTAVPVDRYRDSG